MSTLSMITDGFLDRGRRPALALLVGGLLVDLEGPVDPWSLTLQTVAIVADARSLVASADATAAKSIARAVSVPGTANARSALAEGDAQSRSVRFQ